MCHPACSPLLGSGAGALQPWGKGAASRSLHLAEAVVGEGPGISDTLEAGEAWKSEVHFDPLLRGWWFP